MLTLEEALQETHDWAVDQMNQLYVQGLVEEALAIQSEFCEWLNPNTPEHDIFHLEYLGEEF